MGGARAHGGVQSLRTDGVAGAGVGALLGWVLDLSVFPPTSASSWAAGSVWS
jgi:F0F1-type ATP synthase assembly protein I